jgi:hypothetical protein
VPSAILIFALARRVFLVPDCVYNAAVGATLTGT